MCIRDRFDSAKEALLGTLKQFFAGLARAQLQSMLGSILPKGGFKLPGFASGGSMMLGGIPGVDKNIISMNGIPIARASYGERLDFTNDNGRNTNGGGGRVNNQTFNIYANDADSFRRNQRQISRDAKRRLAV